VVVGGRGGAELFVRLCHCTCGEPVCAAVKAYTFSRTTGSDGQQVCNLDRLVTVTKLSNQNSMTTV